MGKDVATKKDVDRAGLLDAAKKAIDDELSYLKDKIADTMGPEMMWDGDEYAVTSSKRSEIKGKVDYRSALIAAIGVDKVEAMEEKAAKKTSEGGFSLRFRAQFDVESLAKTLKKKKR